MMGKTRQREQKLFYTSFSLEERIGQDNRYRRLNDVLDFSFIRPMVSEFYGTNGQESEDPIVIMKLMLILFVENIPSERELMRRLPERLDWLWFCEFDLDDTLPNHSVPSKARRRWGLEIFEEFFQVVLQQCMAAGLVDGETVHIDSSLIQGNVSADSMRPAFAVLARQKFEQLEESCHEEKTQSTASSKASIEPAPITAKTKLSSSDPEARSRIKGKQKVVGYQEHRVVDDSYGIITANETTDASVGEGRTFTAMLEQHQANTDSTPVHAVADKAYGTALNYQYLAEQKIQPCIPHSEHHSANRNAYAQSRFKYIDKSDHYICPAGNVLKRQSKKPTKRGHIIYIAKAGVCRACPLAEECYGGKDLRRGKSLCRYEGHKYIDWADNCMSKAKRQKLMKRRKSVIEGSFGDAATNHGFKRSRWRGLMRAKIQNTLIATVQNLRKLVKYGRQRRKSVAAAALNHISKSILPIQTACECLFMPLCRDLQIIIIVNS